MMTSDTKVRHNTHDAGYVELYTGPDSGMLVAVAIGPLLPAEHQVPAMRLHALAG